MQNSSLFQSRIIDEYKSNLRSRQGQQKVDQKIQVQRRQTLIEELKRAYKVTLTPLLIPLGRICREEYLIQLPNGNNSFIVIRLQIDDQFPNQRPRLFVEGQCEHELIKKDTYEIDYEKLQPWLPGASQLVKIFQRIEAIFKENRPVFSEDFIEQWGDSIQSDMKKILGDSSFKLLPLEMIFTNVSAAKRNAEYSVMANQPNLVSQQLQCTQEYQKIMEQCLRSSDSIQDLAKNLKEKNTSQAETQSRILAKFQKLDSLQQDSILQTIQVSLIEDRFQPQSAMAIMDSEIYRLDEKLSEEIKLAKAPSQKSLSERAKQFLEYKKQQSLLMKLREGMEKSG